MTEETGTETASFERLFEQLEQHAQRLESGELALQAALTEYETAVGVASQLKELLRGAELRIEELSAVLVEDREAFAEVQSGFDDLFGDEGDV